MPNNISYLSGINSRGSLATIARDGLAHRIKHLCGLIGFTVSPDSSTEPDEARRLIESREVLLSYCQTLTDLCQSIQIHSSAEVDEALPTTHGELPWENPSVAVMMLPGTANHDPISTDIPIDAMAYSLNQYHQNLLSEPTFQDPHGQTYTAGQRFYDFATKIAIPTESHMGVLAYQHENNPFIFPHQDHGIAPALPYNGSRQETGSNLSAPSDYILAPGIDIDHGVAVDVKKGPKHRCRYYGCTYACEHLSAYR